jgi:sugar phosphate isomerase/epimerase
MKWKLGISTNFAIKRWSNPEDWIQIVKEELDLDMIQYSFDQFDPRGYPESLAKYTDRVRNTCARHGVSIHSTFTGLSIYPHNLMMHPLEEGRRDGTDWFEKAFAMTKALGADAIGGPYGGMDLPTYQSVASREEMKGLADQLFVDLLELAPRYGIKTFYWEQTPIMREGPVDMSGTLAHLERINAMRRPGSAAFALCLDVGHAISPDAPNPEDKDLYQWLERLAPYAPIIHLQQTDGRYDRHWPFTGEYNAKGIVEADRVLSAIRRSGASENILLIEVGHAFEEMDSTVLGDLKETVAYWKDALARDYDVQGGTC